MKKRSTFVALLALSTSAALLASACGKKVDCAVFCEREAQCIAEIAVTLGSAKQEQAAAFKPEEKKLLGDKQRERCSTSCADPAKPSAIDDKWNKCLEQTDCKAFAECVYAKK